MKVGRISTVLPTPRKPQMQPSAIELRKWTRETQRAVRLATNALRAAKRKWEEHSSEGLDAANACANSLLTSRYLPYMEWGVLIEDEYLKSSCHKKLQTRLQKQQARCQDCLAALEGAKSEMRAQCGVLGELLSSMEWQRKYAVFTTLSIQKIWDMFNSITEMYEEEFSVRECTFERLTEIVQESTLDHKDDKEWTKSTRDKLQVLLSAWLLAVHLNTDIIESMLQMIIDETHTA